MLDSLPHLFLCCELAAEFRDAGCSTLEALAWLLVRHVSETWKAAGSPGSLAALDRMLQLPQVGRSLHAALTSQEDMPALLACILRMLQQVCGFFPPNI